MRNQKLNISTLIGKGSVMDGDFAAPGSVRIDGKITGNVNVEGILVIGVSGAIKGNVKCSSIIVGGEIEGNVIAPERAELSSESKVMGDIHTKSIIIDEKAVFHGRCVMDEEAEPVREKEGLLFWAKDKKESKKAEEQEREAEELQDAEPSAEAESTEAEHDDGAVSEESPVRDEYGEIPGEETMSVPLPEMDGGEAIKVPLPNMSGEETIKVPLSEVSE